MMAWVRAGWGFGLVFGGLTLILQAISVLIFSKWRFGQKLSSQPPEMIPPIKYVVLHQTSNILQRDVDTLPPALRGTSPDPMNRRSLLAPPKPAPNRFSPPSAFKGFSFISEEKPAPPFPLSTTATTKMGIALTTKEAVTPSKNDLLAIARPSQPPLPTPTTTTTRPAAKSRFGFRNLLRRKSKAALSPRSPSSSPPPPPPKPSPRKAVPPSSTTNTPSRIPRSSPFKGTTMASAGPATASMPIATIRAPASGKEDAAMQALKAALLEVNALRFRVDKVSARLPEDGRLLALLEGAGALHDAAAEAGEGLMKWEKAKAAEEQARLGWEMRMEKLKGLKKKMAAQVGSEEARVGE
ncbi:hypothetical protein BT63DRAFT_427243 [Microthyrium microscopicum]|uniref:Uncharacterized protein n=1 Tax=Microthyrium microscopicum TaxID=703497 RepID=A0A6A6U6X4_9PEZI|nr:hypothetical protein BT63DRAFT_427243 [Microthyrium microscopicum]